MGRSLNTHLRFLMVIPDERGDMVQDNLCAIRLKEYNGCLSAPDIRELSHSGRFYNKCSAFMGAFDDMVCRQDIQKIYGRIGGVK